jgi:5,10-methylenetetrahydromethanopterin reductase
VRIGIFFPSVEHVAIDAMVARFAEVERQGFGSAWVPQSSSYDALTLLAVVGREVPALELGTAVVPTYPRHPMMLASQALTANAATGGRLRLGLGLSHRSVVEGSWGLSYAHPARHMEEYLAVLLPLLRDGEVDFAGEVVTGRGRIRVPGSSPCPVYLAALQPRMLGLAGAVADGTITWCTGPRTLAAQIVPIITDAATAAHRPPPRIVVALPCCVTDDEADGRAQAAAQLRGYGDIPVYRAVLDREGAVGPGDIAVVGDEASVTEQLRRLAAIGATDFMAIPCGTADDRARTRRHLAGLTLA